MPSYQEFLDGQKEVYERFRAGMAKAQTEGVLADPVVTEQRGGLAVVFRHPEPIPGCIAQFAARLAGSVPGAIPYQARHLHTTLSDYGIKAGYRPEDDPAAKETLERLARGVEAALKRLGREKLEACRIDFGGFLMNQNCGIMAGMPNEVWYEIVQAVLASCEQEGVSLRQPWGAHLTILRFGKTHPRQEIGRIFACLSRTPRPCVSRPFALDVCSGVCGVNGFAIAMHKRCRFNQY